MFNSNILTGKQQEMVARLAIGDLEFSSLSIKEKHILIGFGLLEPDYSWNPFVWMYYALNGRGAIKSLGEKDVDFQEWVDYYMTLCK